MNVLLIVLATWTIGLPLAWVLLCELARWMRPGRHHRRTDGKAHLRWEHGQQFHRNDMPGAIR